MSDNEGNNENTMGMLCHLSALSGYVIPFGHIIGPLVVWQLKKSESDYVDYHGKESLNFQITMTLLAIVCTILIVVVIGVFLLPILGLLHLIFTIIASIQANGGTRYAYPFSIKFIK